MSQGEVEAKFTKLAAKALPKTQVSELQETVYGVDKLGDVSLLANNLVPA